MSSPGGGGTWRGAVVLAIAVMIVAQGLIVAATPVMPWLVAGLGLLTAIAVVVYLIIRRGTGW